MHFGLDSRPINRAPKLWQAWEVGRFKGAIFTRTFLLTLNAKPYECAVRKQVREVGTAKSLHRRYLQRPSVASNLRDATLASATMTLPQAMTSTGSPAPIHDADRITLQEVSDIVAG